MIRDIARSIYKEEICTFNGTVRQLDNNGLCSTDVDGVKPDMTAKRDATMTLLLLKASALISAVMGRDALLKGREIKNC